ncbi:MAG: FAD-dependent oxidoreductase [Dongiaceae bacterium]
MQSAMPTQARVVVIGGGVVGASVLYHLARRGWQDVMLIERSELTSGSTWHAAGGMHTLNGDVNMSFLQSYTIKIYDEIERESGQSCGIHRVGCLYLAATEARGDFFKAERAKAHYLGLDLDFMPLDEVAKIHPLVDLSHFRTALFDPNDGHVDPNGVTNAYAKAAQKRGASVVLRNPVKELHQKADGGWRVVTEQGTVEAEYVVNAGGLWAREIGRMAGIELPIVPMEHQYLLTNDLPEIEALDRELPMAIDFEGESYSRQERRSFLIGTYEQDARHWAVDGTPADFGHELLPPDLDRIADLMAIAMERFPLLKNGGIKRVVNGGMVFAPDGNPIIGPVRGLTNYFCACGVMAGFSQGGGVGLAVANWIVDGEPGMDVFAMDVARFGEFVTNKYLLSKTEENYRRRFMLTFPNEELPAARPGKPTPVYPALKAEGAVFGMAFGREYPLWYGNKGENSVETPSFRRSNAFPFVDEECRAVREAVGIWETSTYSKFEIAGPHAAEWLDNLVANKLPSRPGRTVLCPVLTRTGRVAGDLTVTRLESERFLLVGSGSAEEYYRRLFASLQSGLLPGRNVEIVDVTEALCGFSISGPRARDLLVAVTQRDVSDHAFPFLSAAHLAIGNAQPLVVRISFTGELGYELYMPEAEQLAVYSALIEAGRAFDLRHFGVRALNSLRLEKGYGSWGREYTMDYTPFEAALDRFVRPEKGSFIGRDAVQKMDAASPARRLALFAIDADEADPHGSDPMGGEPLFHRGRCVGRLTSGGYGHWVEKSLGLGYLPADAAADGQGFEVEILGRRRHAELLDRPPYDPDGFRLRS